MNKGNDTEHTRLVLEAALNKLIKTIGDINIGSSKQFPFGWRKAAKGRTVWRIIEEAISQNLEKYHDALGFSEVNPSDSEVSVYDVKLKLKESNKPIYMNIKSAVAGVKSSKDDISKAVGLKEFYEEDISKELFIATFEIDFKADMKIELSKCSVMPIAWIPDVYVNPSNNGNFQSSKYKNLDEAIIRSNEEFYSALIREMKVAYGKKERKKNNG